tara:strand:- start:208 stop:507 length:300 start_codon:yes stop_codon:yes gene_type:complete
MQKNKLTLGILVCGIAILSSCESHDECHECHIALKDAQGVEIGEHEIGEFCGDALEDIESAGYNLAEEVVYNNDQDTLSAGLIPAEDIHCEEHGDDHDH